ncbi:PQQ-dependent sugar dehydrogenase [Luteimonas sp. 8-5]|uniref:PQQ-dependent sugar dehydrogenase n=1 Tax=Luteimonas sp. 8-5 TaxID=3039387 RepID=UPI002436B95E|nr:PQQ-dependent sugar dehydrogenase [Luteimonas sp. 8-5]MDG6347517.1 PQQ-dependent sugar dehydrogenase [Luteimonas sp. 8-5]
MPRVGNPVLLALCAGLLAACGDMGNKDATAATTTTQAAEPETATGFATTELARFDSPWAMTFLPDGRLLVTEMGGTLKLFDPGSGKTGSVPGVPSVVHRGQGGFGDVVLHPRFADNQLLYISYVEAGDGGTGSAVARARLALDDAGGGALENLQVIWRQEPKTGGNGHYGQRIAFGPDGMLYISSSERQKFDPAQDMSMNLGKIVRLNDDGTVPADNPFVAQGGVAAQVWTLGHRNVLGLAFDGNGQLWAHEMGPRGGDELNRIEKGTNYGYPLVSEGNHYSGLPIPDHDTRPEFRAPVIAWTPVISPAGLVFYDGDLFPAWKGDAFIGGLSSQSLVRIEFDGNGAREAQRFDMGRRVREVEQGPDGALWLLGDGSDGPLLKLVPREP